MGTPGAWIERLTTYFDSLVDAGAVGVCYNDPAEVGVGDSYGDRDRLVFSLEGVLDLGDGADLAVGSFLARHMRHYHYIDSHHRTGRSHEVEGDSHHTRPAAGRVDLERAAGDHLYTAWEAAEEAAADMPY